MTMRRTVLMLAALALLTAVRPARASGDDAEPWLRELHHKDRVTTGEVLLAAALISDDKQWHEDPDWALKVAKRRDLLFCRPPGGLKAHARREWAASVFARLLDIEGGLWSRILDQSPRYAYRELVTLGLIAPGGPRVPLNGDELAGLLLAAERYRKHGPERLPQRGVTP